MREFFEIKGVDDLVKALKRLDFAVEKKLLKDAMRQAGQPVLAAAKQLCPVDTGRLRESLKLSVSARKGKGVFVYIKIGTGDFKGKTFYGPMVELGHFLGSRKLGNKRTVIAPRPFLRPAFDAHREEAVRIAGEVLKEGVSREFAKGNTH